MPPTSMRRALRPVAIVLATAIACICIIYFSIPMGDTRQDHFDLILVLGNPAEPDGSIGPVARSRVTEAIRQYRAGVAPHMLLTGGAVQNRFVEAQVMQQFARSQGVPAAAMLTDGQAQNTIQNAFYAYRIMQAHDWTSVLIVSSPSHLRRASLIFRYYPIQWRMDPAPLPAGYPLWKQAWFWCREVGYSSYVRIFGFPNEGQYLPRTHFTFPRI